MRPVASSPTTPAVAPTITGRSSILPPGSAGTGCSAPGSTRSGSSTSYLMRVIPMA